MNSKQTNSPVAGRVHTACRTRVGYPPAHGSPGPSCSAPQLLGRSASCWTGRGGTARPALAGQEVLMRSSCSSTACAWWCRAVPAHATRGPPTRSPRLRTWSAPCRSASDDHQAPQPCAGSRRHAMRQPSVPNACLASLYPVFMGNLKTTKRFFITFNYAGANRKENVDTNFYEKMRHACRQDDEMQHVIIPKKYEELLFQNQSKWVLDMDCWSLKLVNIKYTYTKYTILTYKYTILKKQTVHSSYLIIYSGVYAVKMCNTHQFLPGSSDRSTDEWAPENTSVPTVVKCYILAYIDHDLYNGSRSNVYMPIESLYSASYLIVDCKSNFSLAVTIC